MKQYFGYKNAYNGRLFLLCWIAYFSTYICRLNFSAVMPELLGSGSFTQSQTAAVSSAFFICYGIGQLFSGILGDRFSPRILIFIGVTAAAVSNILIYAFSFSYAALITLWAANGITQSLTWTPLLKIAGDYLSDGEKTKFGVDISTTVPLGTLASYGVSLVTLLVLDWEYVFLVCGIIVLAAGIYWIIGTAGLDKKMKNTDTSSVAEHSAVKAISGKKLIKIIFSSAAFALLLPVAFMGTLKDSVTQWIPTFLESEYDLGTSLSLALAMILPIINVTGAYFAKMINKKLKNELTTSAVLFGIASAFLVVLMIFGNKNALLSLICMAGITNCMFAINVMLITMVPFHFSRFGRTGTVGGLLNAVAYIGCGLLNMGAGEILENNSSWNILFIMWLAVAVSAALITICSASRWKKFINSEPRES